MSMSQDEYEYNLLQLKRIIDEYTIADLNSMIYTIPISKSGACCYPAIQTLISLMELLGRIINGKEKYEAFYEILKRLGDKYNNDDIAKKLYGDFRHGIAHNSLAKGRVLIKKDGNNKLHLQNNVIVDIKIMFNDFLNIYESLFNADNLMNPKQRIFYERNLRKVFTALNYAWILDFKTNLIDEKKRTAIAYLTLPLPPVS